MALTFEFATFTVREGEEEALLTERPQMIEALRRAFPGLLAAWLTKQDDGSWTDVILWQTRAEAERAAKQAKDIPEARAWFRHIGESRSLRHAQVAHEQFFAVAPRRGPAGASGIR
jgi:hypothetical protein